MFPEQASGLLVKGVDAFVLGAGNEVLPAGGHNRAAVRFGAGPGANATCGQLHVLSQGNALPDEFAGVQVDLRSIVPRGSFIDRSAALVVEELFVARRPIGTPESILARPPLLRSECDDIGEIIGVYVEISGGRIE